MNESGRMSDDVPPPHSDADFRGGGKQYANGHDHSAQVDDNPRESFPLIWYGDIDGPASYEQLVEDLLLEGSFAVIYGESNSGKTFFIMDLALSVCQGIAWRGRSTRKGLVIYVAGEGAASVRNRVAAYRKARPFVAGSAPFAILPTAVDFMEPYSVQKLVGTVLQAQALIGETPAMVVVDTLARAMAGGEENSTMDMGLVVSAADAVRQATGATVCFVHHTGKDASKGARGSGALRAATDTEMLVEGTQGPRTVSVTKQRDLDLGEKMVFGLEVIEIGTNPKNGKTITSCTVMHMDGDAIPPPKAEIKGKNQRMLIAALRVRSKDNPGKPWTLPELRTIARELGIPKQSAQLVVDTIANGPFMQWAVGGYTFTDGNH